mmetsp:Transcript_35625/g.83814  ORF Transcript_35625/g.83814 Transcript_35625/m.83814 type:complete len:210 (-) Transcript_35625:210-839(-)
MAARARHRTQPVAALHALEADRAIILFLLLLAVRRAVEAIQLRDLVGRQLAPVALGAVQLSQQRDLPLQCSRGAGLLVAFDNLACEVRGDGLSADGRARWLVGREHVPPQRHEERLVRVTAPELKSHLSAERPKNKVRHLQERLHVLAGLAIHRDQHISRQNRPASVCRRPMHELPHHNHNGVRSRNRRGAKRKPHTSHLRRTHGIGRA